MKITKKTLKKLIDKCRFYMDKTKFNYSRNIHKEYSDTLNALEELQEWREKNKKGDK